MPGRFFLTTPIQDVAAALSADVADLPDQAPRNNVSPGEEIVVMGSDRTFQTMRWGMIPVGRVNARGRPVMETIINARSETVFAKSAFEGVGRAVVPADGWYEWTGKARRKTAWRIRRADGEHLLFAAITDVWAGPSGIKVPQAATVTCDPSDDVKDIHHRMGVILTPDTVEDWLTGDKRVASALCAPTAKGTLHVEEATDVDWSAP